jgi:GTP-binding protein
LNKADLLSSEQRALRRQQFVREIGPEACFMISAMTGEGCKELSAAIMQFLDRTGAAREATDFHQDRTD